MDDLISRQDAIDAMEKYLDKFDCIDANFLDGLKTTKKILNDLPSAQQEIIRCKDCKYAHLTYDGECKYCDMWTDDDGRMLKLYADGDFYCADAERRTDGRNDTYIE